jgi:thiol-disulfide isomerase/thioredoxin
MKNYLIFALVLFSEVSAFSQAVKVPLIDKLGNRSLISYFREVRDINNKYSPENKNDYKGYDTSKYVSWQIKTANFSVDQGNIEMFLKGRLTKQSLNEMLNRAGTDTSQTIYRTIPGSKIAVFLGIDDQNLKHIIVDANGDKDFGNDKKFVFKPGVKLYPQLTIKIDYPEGEIIRSKNLPFFIYTDPISFNNDVMGMALIERSYKEGVLKTKDGDFFIDVDNEDFFLYKGEGFYLTVMPVKGSIEDNLTIDVDSIKANKLLRQADSITNARYIYSNKDSIQVGYSLYKIDSLANDTLYLKYIKKVADHGELNTIAPNIIGNDLLSKLPFSLRKKRGSYVMIDFWGSWCGPCIAALPKLVEVQNKYKDKGLVTLSIAMDQLKDLEKLKSMIIDQKLDWTNLFVDRNGSMTILKDYRMQRYPTTLLIDPRGKVVLRGIGAKALEEIDEYLSKKL